MTEKNNKKKMMADESCTDGMTVFGMRCLARVAAPHLGLSRVRLTVTEPRCCFPCLGKRREVASFSFKEEDWTKILGGDYESSMVYSVVDLSRLRHLQEDLPVKVKWWAGRRKGKTRLDDSLGEVLHLLRAHTNLTLQVVVSCEEVTVGWVAPDTEGIDGTTKAPADLAQYDDESLDSPIYDYCTFINDRTGRIITLPAHDQAARSGGVSFPGAWTDEDDELDEEDLKLVSALDGVPSSLTQEQQALSTYINNATGRVIILPAHEQKESWIFPGAWTSQDDQLDEEDLRLVSALGNVSSSLTEGQNYSEIPSPPEQRQHTPQVGSTPPLEIPLKGPSREVLWTFVFFLLLALWVVWTEKGVM